MIGEHGVGRVPSARPSSGVLLSRAGRVPSSHHGVHTPMPMTAGGMFRMPKDKRYYMHTMKSHMNLIREELIKLQRQTAIYRTTGNQTAFRKIAESSAQTYSENQELLTIYNLVLEIQASQDKYVKLSYETNLLKEKNKLCLTDLDNLISARVLREESIEGIKKEIEEEQRYVQEIIDSLPDDEKAQYTNLYNNNKSILPKIRKTEDELKACRESYKQLKKTLNKSVNKQKYFVLIQNLNKGKKHKESLEIESKEMLTPTQQRENLIQQVRTNKADTESLLNMLKLLEQDYQSKEERLEILKFQLSENNAKHLKKHKELRQREILINSFNSTFPEKSASLIVRIETAKNEILLLLKASAKSIADLNFEELDNIQLNLNQSSEADIKDRINLFAMRLARLLDCKVKYQKDIEAIKEKRVLLQRDLKKFENPERVKEDTETKYLSQTYKRDELRHTLLTTKSAVTEAERIQAELDPQLYDNNIYKTIQELEKELEAVDNEIQDIKSSLNQMQIKEAISNKLRDIESLVFLKNEQLVKTARAKKPKVVESTP
ncbi:hypothetical protein RN001_015842 [Aquatica leii]|uniref:Uncharacterized protein n=1 Tax=Aquatica leii TaxID=1421715 RepID=A0AAN7NZI4_9COLE|nr:hypothetical protein RN001_015842 [Aquatica leii]